LRKLAGDLVGDEDPATDGAVRAGAAIEAELADAAEGRDGRERGGEFEVFGPGEPVVGEAEAEVLAPVEPGLGVEGAVGRGQFELTLFGNQPEIRIVRGDRGAGPRQAVREADAHSSGVTDGPVDRGGKRPLPKSRDGRSGRNDVTDELPRIGCGYGHA